MENVYTVKSLTQNIKKLLEGSPNLNNLWLKGEIYNLTYHSSGHIYFSLKDDDALIAATFFSFANKYLKIKLENGMSVLVKGKISLFEKRGTYQINVAKLQLEGVGELQKRIEEIKKRLNKEGIFNEEHKKKLPFLPKKIGVVTSPTGAAVRDIIKVAIRRFPNLEILIAPAKVQGDDAPATIIKGIKELNKKKWAVDVIIAGRGGGSFEDLLPFNDEGVVRAFYESEVPIVSAVGHQIDHPMCDDAADIFVATPSAAAEIVVPDKSDLLSEIDYLNLRMQTAIENLTKKYWDKIDSIEKLKIFREPNELLVKAEMELQDFENRMVANVQRKIFDKKNQLMQISDINFLIRSAINTKKYSFNLLLESINKLSPLKIMERGYSVVRGEEDNIISTIANISVNDIVKINFIDGSVNCSVVEKEVLKDGNKKYKF